MNALSSNSCLITREFVALGSVFLQTVNFVKLIMT